MLQDSGSSKNGKEAETRKSLQMAKSRKTREGNFIEDIVYHRLGSPSVAEDNVRATVTPEELKSITSQQAGHTSSWTCLSPLTSVHYLKDRLRGEPVGSEYKKTVPCSLFYNLHDAANPYEDGGTWGSFGDRMEDNVSKHHTVRISHLGNDETSGEVTKTEKKSSVELLDKMTVLSKWQSIVPVDHKQTNTDFAAETGIKTQLSDDCYKSSLATSGRDSSDGFSDTLLNDNRRKRSSPSEDSELLDISEGTSFLPDLETSSEAIHITDQWVSTSTVPYVEFRQSIKKNEVMSKSPKQILMPITPATAINDFSVRHYADEKQNAKSKVHHDPLQLQSTSHRLKSSEERDNVSVVNSTTMDATNSGQSDQRTASPSLLSTSSLATCKYLEWDSGADIGYEGPKVIYGLSPLERMAIGSYCSGIQRMEPEGNNSQLKDSLPANIQPEGLPNLDKLAAEEREKLKESKELEKLSPSPKMFLDVESPKSDAMHSRLHKETFSEWPISNRKPTCISLNPFCSTVVNDEDQCLPAKLSFHTPATNAHLPTTCTSANQCTSKKKNMCNMQDASSETSSSPHSTKKMSSKALAEQNDLATRSSNYDDQNVIFKTKKFVDEVCQKSDLSKKHCLLKKILEDLGTSLSNDDIVSLYHNSNVSQTFKRDVPLTEFLPRSTETMKTILPPYTAFTDSHRSECDSNHEANEESNSKDSYHDSGTIVVKPYSSHSSDYLFYAPVSVGKRHCCPNESEEPEEMSKSETGNSPENSGDVLMLRGKKRYDDKMRHFHEHRLTSMERHGSDVHGFQNDVHKGINEVEVVSDCKQSREAQDGSDGQSRENMLQNSSLDKPSSCDKGFQVGNRITIPEQFSTQGREFANRNAARQSKKNLRNEMIQLRRESHSSHSSSFNSINSLVVSSHSFEMNHTSTTSRTSSHTSSRFSYNSQHHYIKNKQNQHIKSSSKDSVNCSVGYVSSSSGDYTFYRKLKSKESRHQKDLYYVKELINRQRNHYIKKFRKELEWLEKVEDYLALADNSNQSAFTESASSSSLMSGRLHLLTKLESLRINRGKHQERQKTRNLPTRSSYMSDHENQNGSLITEKHQLTLSSQDSELVGPVPSDQAEVGMNRVHSSFTTDSGTQTSINIYKEPLDQDRKTHIDEKKTINEDSSRRRQRASSKDQDISQGLSSDELKNNAWFIPFHQMSAEDCPYCQRQQQVLQITFKGGPSLSRLSLQDVFLESNPKVMRRLIRRHQKVKSRASTKWNKRAIFSHNEMNLISIKMKTCNYTVPLPISTQHHNPKCRYIFQSDVRSCAKPIPNTMLPKYNSGNAKTTNEKNKASHMTTSKLKKKFQEKLWIGKSLRPSFHKCI